MNINPAAGEVWDSVRWRTHRDATLMRWLGDRDAVDFLVAVSTAAEVWDDAYDGDKAPDMDAAMTALFVALPLNPFWRRFQEWLMPMVVVSINAWMDSRAMEKTKDATRTLAAEAFVLRNLGLELVMLSVFLLHGFERMREISMEVRSFARHETFLEWEAQHATS